MQLLPGAQREQTVRFPAQLNSPAAQRLIRAFAFAHVARNRVEPDPEAQAQGDQYHPDAKRHQPWLDRLRLQMIASLAAIDRYLGERGAAQWLVGGRMTQADITAVCAFTFLNDTLRVASDAAMLQSLAVLAGRCEAMKEFSETRMPFVAPGR